MTHRVLGYPKCTYGLVRRIFLRAYSFQQAWWPDSTPLYLWHSATAATSTLIIGPAISMLSVSTVVLDKFGLIDLWPAGEKRGTLFLALIVGLAIGAFVDWECRHFREHPEAAIPYGSKSERRKLWAGLLIAIGLVLLPPLTYVLVFW